MSKTDAEAPRHTEEQIVGSDSAEVCKLKNDCIDLSFEVAVIRDRLRMACDHIDALVQTMEGKVPPGHPFTMLNAAGFSRDVRAVWLTANASGEGREV